MGTKSTQTTAVPEYVDQANQMIAGRLKQIMGMGDLPYMGPEVAAVNPYEQALAQNVGGMASALGLAAPAGMNMSSMPTVSQGGVSGYSSYPIREAALQQLQQSRPEQYQYFSDLTRFDPITGALNEDYEANLPQIIRAAAAASGGGDGGGGNGGFYPLTSSSGGGSNTTFSGGGADNVGNFGTFGDYLGGIGDAIGITDYASQAAPKVTYAPAPKPKTKPKYTPNYSNGGFDI
tara:strand:- start:1990 stop:2691 length:702 start_codon:yes stop_codon:yes gene_type:complete